LESRRQFALEWGVTSELLIHQKQQQNSLSYVVFFLEGYHMYSCFLEGWYKQLPNSPQPSYWYRWIQILQVSLRGKESKDNRTIRFVCVR
jgi:hypothetical protein